MREHSNEQRSVVQVARMLNALRLSSVSLCADIPPRPDVAAELDGGRRIAIETTEYHGDETNRGGSGTRRNEQRDAAAGRMRTYAVPTNPLHGLISRIQAKTSKQYDLSGSDEAWLVIFAGVPQSGAVAATFLVTTFLNGEQLTIHTSALLEASIFSRSYLFCELTELGRPRLYGWQKGRDWTEVSLPGQTTPPPSPTFWDIQKAFRQP
jgi:hypothetical protein